MRLTKFRHACVRLDKGDRSLVIDPGSLSEDPPVDRVDAILLTHEHFDHFNLEHLSRAAEANPSLAIYTNESVAARLTELPADVHVAQHGDEFEIAGFRIGVAGEWHAPNLPDAPIPRNIGFMIDHEVFYPGDAFTVPDESVNTLLVPTCAPWLKAREMIEYLRAVRPARAFSTHDGLYTDVGLRLIDTWLATEGEKQNADMRRLAPGESVSMPAETGP